MALRSQETARFLIAAALWLAPAFGQEFRYEARHDHLWKGRAGALTIDGRGIAFQEAGKPKKHPHEWRWTWRQIQQLEMAPKTLRVLTYRDNLWKLGADREYRFDLTAGTFANAYDFLKARLDQRFVAVLADQAAEPLWRIPVKHLTRFGGSEGELIAGRDRIVFEADKKSEARTWRYSDIENISSSGPFQLTLTTHERALSHYGSLKGFNFQLREPLAEARYEELWRRVNGTKDLKFLSTYKETTSQ